MTTREDLAGASQPADSRARSFGVRALDRMTGALVLHVMPVEYPVARWWATVARSDNRVTVIDHLDDDYQTIRVEDAQ